MEYIYVGRIVNTHGIRGEVRILSDFKYKSRVFVCGNTIYIGNEKIKEVIASYRFHKIFDMITLEGISNINDVLKYKGKKIYVLRDELHLAKGEYLGSDLIGLDVLVHGRIVGKVIAYLDDIHQDKIVVNKDNLKYYVPFVDDIIENINIEDGNISIKDIKGLLD